VMHDTTPMVLCNHTMEFHPCLHINTGVIPPVDPITLPEGLRPLSPSRVFNSGSSADPGTGMIRSVRRCERVPDNILIVHVTLRSLYTGGLLTPVTKPSFC
jgi:hypothetical protein